MKQLALFIGTIYVAVIALSFGLVPADPAPAHPPMRPIHNDGIPSGVSTEK